MKFYAIERVGESVKKHMSQFETSAEATSLE
jgi:hypothetical protein